MALELSQSVAAQELNHAIAAMAGLKDQDANDLDGVDLSDLLVGRSEETPERSLYWDYGRCADHIRPFLSVDRSPNLAVRRGRWKLLINADETRPELYDLSADPVESKNLARDQAKVVGDCVRGTGQAWNPQVAAWADANLRRFTDEWRRHYHGYLPVKNDVDATEAGVRDSNLILFGDPGSNSGSARRCATPGQMHSRHAPTRRGKSFRRQSCRGTYLSQSIPRRRRPLRRPQQRPQVSRRGISIQLHGLPAAGRMGRHESRRQSCRRARPAGRRDRRRLWVLQRSLEPAGRPINPLVVPKSLLRSLSPLSSRRHYFAARPLETPQCSRP